MRPGKWAIASPEEALSIIAGKNGIPADAARARLMAIADDYRPRAASLQCVTRQRAELGLPGAEGGVDALFEPSLIGMREA